MGFALSQVVCVNVDNVATDGLSRVQSQSQVLVFGVERQVLLIDGSFVDCIGTRVIDHFTVKENNKNTQTIKFKLLERNVYIFFLLFLSF